VTTVWLTLRTDLRGKWRALGLAGLIALAVIGQLLGRQLALDSAEFPVLRALGATRASLVGLSLARLAVVTVAGGIVAVALAIAASPLMPIGPARLAEPHPGTEVNLAILGIGFAAVALLPIASLAAAAVFGTSLVMLLSTPRAYGQNWDAQLDLGFGGVPGSIGATAIKAESAVTGYAPGNYGQLTIDGQIVPSIGIDQPRAAGSGGGYLTITAGRAPATPGEIALGAQTMHVGDREPHRRLARLDRRPAPPRPRAAIGVTP
jgi:hypothetical protein